MYIKFLKIFIILILLEFFLRKRGDIIIIKLIKGIFKCGKILEEDRILKE